jgi:hypothetical protein
MKNAKTKISESRKKWNEINKEKLKLTNKLYYKNNKEEVKEKSKNYYEANKEEHNKRSINWRENNPERSKELNHKNWLEIKADPIRRKKKYKKVEDIHKEYYKNDVIFKLKKLIRCRLNQSLKANKSNKNNSSIKYIGCSIEEFKLYIEKQFLPEMSWDNWGRIWELDHKKGCCNFDLNIESEVYKCFNYKNQKPIFKTTEIAEQFGYKDQIGNRNKIKKWK